MTSQLSKAIERLLRSLFRPYLLKSGLFGCNQFAYTPERGARDGLVNLVITWIMALAKRRKVAIYCSDVFGAFDQVKLERLAAKLKAKKIHPEIIDVLVSWLKNRRARVVVGMRLPKNSSWKTWCSKERFGGLCCGTCFTKTQQHQ